MAYPLWVNPPHEYSRMFPSNKTRCAFFNSKRFLTINGLPSEPPTKPGWPSIQVKGLKKWFWLIWMSAGVTVLEAPPSRMFSPEDSRKLLTTLNGPTGLLEPPPTAAASVQAPVFEMQ